MLSLPSIEIVKKFVSVANDFEFPISLLSDKYKIDAKSIMGIFSLDLSKPVKLQVESGYDDKFIQAIAQFKVEE